MLCLQTTIDPYGIQVYDPHEPFPVGLLCHDETKRKGGEARKRSSLLSLSLLAILARLPSSLFSPFMLKHKLLLRPRFHGSGQNF